MALQKLKGFLLKELIYPRPPTHGKHIQLILEQLRFKLSGSTYTWIFKNKNTRPAFDLWLGVPRCGGRIVCIDLLHFI